MLEKLTCQPPLPRQVRQRCAIILKQYTVRHHWDSLAVQTHAKSKGGSGSGAPGTEHFVLPMDEKAAIREALPHMLAETDGSVRRLMAVALAEIGKKEWPEQWPGFVEGLCGLVSTAAASASAGAELDMPSWLAADGALEALEPVASSCDTSVMPDFAVAVGPILLSITSLPDPSPDTGAAVFVWGMKARALDGLLTIIDVLNVTKEMRELKKGVKALMKEMVPHVLSAISATLATPGWYPAIVRAKHAAFRCLNVLCTQFTDHPVVKNSLPHIISNMVSFGAACVAEYVRVDVDEGEAEELPSGGPGSLDSYSDAEDGGYETSLGSLVIDFVQFVSSMLMSTVKVATKAVRENLHSICAILLASCQLTEEALARWEGDEEAYLADETDEGYDATVRTEVDTALGDMFEGLRSMAHTGLVGVTGAAAAALAVVSAADGAGLPALEHPAASASLASLAPMLSRSKWKVAEATVYFVGCVAPDWTDIGKDMDERVNIAGRKFGAEAAAAKQAELAGQAAELALDPTFLASELVSLIYSGGTGLVPPDRAAECAPYLLGRALWCAARLSDMLSPEASGTLIEAAMDGLQDSYSLPIRLAACVSLSRLLKRAPEGLLDRIGPVIVERVFTLLKDAAAANSTNIRDLLRLAVKAAHFAPAAVCQYEGSVTPLFLALMIKHFNDNILCNLASLGVSIMIGQDDDKAAESAAARALEMVSSILRQTAERTHASNRGAGSSSSADDSEYPDGFVVASLDIVRSVIERLHESHRRTSGAVPGAPDPAPVLSGLCAPLATVVEIMTSTTNGPIVGECAKVLATAVRVFGPNLVSDSTPSGHPAVSLESIGQCLSALFNTSVVTDSAAATAGGLVMSLFRFLLPAADASVSQAVLEMTARRIAAGRQYSTLQSLAGAMAYAIISDQTSDNVVTQFLVDTRVPLPPTGPFALGDTTGPAIAVWARCVANCIDLPELPLLRHLLMAATARVLTHRPAFAALTPIRVDGETLETLDEAGTTGVVTRAMRKRGGVGLKSTTVALSVRLLTKFMQVWLPQCEEALGLEEEEDDGYVTESSGDEDDDDQDGEEGGADDGPEAEDLEGLEELGARRRRKGGPSPFVDASLMSNFHEDGDEDGGNNGVSKAGKKVDRETYDLSDLMMGGGLLAGMSLEQLLSGGKDGAGGFSSDDDDDLDDNDDGAEVEADNELGIGGYELDDATGVVPGDPLLSRLTASTVAEEGHSFLTSLMAAAAGDSAAQGLLAATSSQLGQREMGRIQALLAHNPGSHSGAGSA
jgi:hypothetical protein